MTIQQHLIESFVAYKDNTAIEYEGNRINYDQLRNNADRMTDDILRRGVHPETVIGISLTAVEEIITSIIGVINARCVFVLLDQSLPESVLDSMLGDLNLKYVIASESSKIRGLGLKNEIDLIDYEREMMTGMGKIAIAYPDFNGADNLYIYFTSGSSGTPKGVVGINASLMHFLHWELETFVPDSSFRFSQFVSPYFDAFLRDIFLPILTGGTICIPPGGKEFFEGTAMTNWLDENRIHFIHCVPSVFRLLNTDWLTQENFSQLKFILMSGEKLIPGELTNWYSKFDSRIQLVNLYGSTEATMVQSCYLIGADDPGKNRISIGDPIWDTEFIVSNGSFKPCGPLVTGNLYIVSDFMAGGYLNNPDLTGEKFLNIERAGVAKIGYRTGDKARILIDGSIELMGREDRQVKVRGIRIEPDEIENVLLRSELVRSAYVMKHQGINNDESLVAFIILNEGQVNDSQWADEIQQYARVQLPEYMIPSKFVEMKEFPLSSNGKIDYRKLIQTDVVNDDIITPGDELESGILAIWKEIVGDKPISVEDSFHKVGGNSLSIMKLIGRIYKKYNVRIALSELFDNLTVKKQAAIIRRTNNDYLYLIPRADKKEAYHVSSVQERLYYNHALRKESITYNLTIALEMKGGLEIRKTEGILRELIARHEALRTGFILKNGELGQVVHDTVEFNLEETLIKDEHIQEAIVRYIRPFDLSKAPLMRAGILTTKEGKQILVVDFHHIICDGMSQMILFLDFLKLYSGNELTPISVQLKDYAEWEWSFRSSAEYLSHREFWLEKFGGEIPRIDLPVSVSGNEFASDKGGNVFFGVDKNDISLFINYLHDNGLTNFSGLFSLYFMFLSQLTGQEDLVIGIVASGRMQEELENVVGTFVKTLPIRYKLDPNILLSDLLKDISNYLIQANSRQIYDLSNIMIDLNSKYLHKQESLFDVLFIFQDFDRDHVEKDNYAMHRVDNGSSKYPLSLYIIDIGSSFTFRMEYLSAYFTESDAEILAAQLKGLIEKISGQIDMKVIDIIGLHQEVPNLAEDDLSFNF